MRRFLLLAMIFVAALDHTAFADQRTPLEPYEIARWPIGATALDEIVLQMLTKQGASLNLPASDTVFIRRVFLDLLGTVPEPEEVDAFIADPSPLKRAVLVDQLFLREEYVEYTSLKWADLLRIKSEFPINLWPNATQAYHLWVSDAVRKNMPYDAFARALLLGSGSNFRQPESNFYRALEAKTPATIAKTVALTWIALRFDDLPAAVKTDFMAFFSSIDYKKTLEWKEEIVVIKPMTETVTTRFPDGTPVTLRPGVDPRAVFTDWLLSPENPWFARAAVNRAWARFFGRGIIEPVDTITSTDVSPVLDFLASEFIASGYDMRALYRIILNSRTYQQSSLPPSTAASATTSVTPSIAWARYGIRRLDAEVLIDALNRIGGTGEAYYSAIPEPFTYIPTTARSISLADGSITSAFLMRFGRPARDSGLASERSSVVDEEQLRYLLNSTEVRKKIEQGPRLQKALSLNAEKRPEQVRELYRQILSRTPTAAETKKALSLLSSSVLSTRAAAADLAWALVNSAEFLYQH